MTSVSRRGFLASLTGLTATVAVGCRTETPLANAVEPMIEGGGPPSIPAIVNPTSPVPATEAVRIDLAWDEAAGATAYDVELNDVMIATDLRTRGLSLSFGDRRVPPQAGPNRWRVRAKNGTGHRWSLPATFLVESVRQVRARSFDHEDPGPIETTVPSEGTVLTVGERYRFGTSGRGVALRCTDKSNTRAYKNHEQMPVDECWIRLCVRPERWSVENRSINLARIRTFAGDTAINAAATGGEPIGDADSNEAPGSVADQRAASESLYWLSGSGFRTTSVAPSAGLPGGAWTQVQMGVKADGTVELWQFDGHTEIQVGVGRNLQMTDQKSQVSFGNINPNLNMTFEVWLDELAVGQQKLPWVSPLIDRAEVERPRPLEPTQLGERFSFVFGSCNNASLLPYDSMAIGAAARMDADFMIHLGDHGYPDTGAYRQSAAAYTALWSDLGQESNVASLLKKPWLMVASDHDLGGNNISAETIVPFASEAFDAYNQNDTAAQPQGRFGNTFLADGEIELVWLEEIVHRSAVKDFNGPSKTCLGPEQKEWFLDRIRRSEAALMIIASQTTIGHVSESGWVQYEYERSELIQACLERDGWTRWLSGDKHTARWAYFEERLVEWGAAAWAEIPQGTPQPASRVQLSQSGPAGAFPTRKAALETLGLNGVANATSFGFAEIDTRAGTAYFSVRDNSGEVRVQRDGTVLEEEINYRDPV